MKKAPKKLELNRETLRMISGGEIDIRQVGVSAISTAIGDGGCCGTTSCYASCATTCPEHSCPPASCQAYGCTAAGCP